MATISIFSGAAIGLLYGSLGPSYVFLIISILYVISFILTSQIPSTKQIKENQNNQGLLGSTKESIAYLFHNKMILGNTQKCYLCTASGICFHIGPGKLHEVAVRIQWDRSRANINVM